MGYRSDVYIKCTKEAVGAIYSALQTSRLAEIATMTYDDELFYFNIYNVKWYPSYDEISSIMDVLQKHESHIGYLCVGEESDDVEERGNLDFTWYREVCIDDLTVGPHKTSDYITKHHPELVI